MTHTFPPRLSYDLNDGRTVGTARKAADRQKILPRAIGGRASGDRRWRIGAAPVVADDRRSRRQNGVIRKPVGILFGKDVPDIGGRAIGHDAKAQPPVTDIGGRQRVEKVHRRVLERGDAVYRLAWTRVV